MSLEKEKILEFNQYMKSDKMQFIIYSDIESLIKKKRWMCKQFNSVTTKLREFLANTQFQQFRHLITQKTYFISWKRFCENVLCFSKRTHKVYN